MPLNKYECQNSGHPMSFMPMVYPKPDVFKSLEKLFGIKLCSVPSQRHKKNMIEPCYGVLRPISLRFRDAGPDVQTQLSGNQSVRIYNYLYGNDAVSSFELSKGSTPRIRSRRTLKSSRYRKI